MADRRPQEAPGYLAIDDRMAFLLHGSRGRTSVHAGFYEWRGDLAGGEAGFLPLLWTASGACEGLTAELPGSGGGALCRASKRTLSFRLRRGGNGEWRDVRLDAGRFLALE